MIAYDIETLPLLSSLASPYPTDRSAPANYKSEEAITKWRAADESGWQAQRGKECSLNPRLGRVVAISYCGANGSDVVLAKTEADERAALEDFWDRVRTARTIAGWNSQGFDLPFLLVRSALVGVMPMMDVAPFLRRYSYTPHFDVKAALLQWDVRKAGEGLSEWATAFGLEQGKAGHGSEVAGMVEREEWDALTAYAEQDAILTYALAQRAAPYFGVLP